jgi:hypothetical protein
MPTSSTRSLCRTFLRANCTTRVDTARAATVPTTLSARAKRLLLIVIRFRANHSDRVRPAFVPKVPLDKATATSFPPRPHPTTKPSPKTCAATASLLHRSRVNGIEAPVPHEFGCPIFGAASSRLRWAIVRSTIRSSGCGECQDFRCAKMTHLSDAKTVAKMGHRLWYGQMWATRPFLS